MLAHRYGNLVLFNLGAYGGIFIILLISDLLANIGSQKNIFNRIFGYFGINSISIMIVHEPIKRIILKLFSMLTGLNINLIRENILLSLICVIIILIIIIPITYITTHYFPWVYGKRKNTEK